METRREARERVRAYRLAVIEGRVLAFPNQVFISYPTLSHRDHALAEAKTRGINVRIVSETITGRFSSGPELETQRLPKEAK